MINRVRIEAFKSLAEADIELGRFNVFVGPNGSGKSNFLEALGVLGAAASGRVDDEALLRRGVRPGVPALYKTSFTGTTMKNAISLEAHSDGLRYRVGLHNPASKPRPAWLFKTESLARDGRTLFGASPRSKSKPSVAGGLLALRSLDFEQDSPEDVFTRTLQSYAIYTPNTPTLRGIVADPQPRDPVGLNGSRLAEAYGELLRGPYRDEVIEARNTLVDWVEAISVGPPRLLISSSVNAPRRALVFRDRFMASGRKELTAYDASEGALYILFALVLLFHENSPQVLAIDNYDQALNPLLARRLTFEMCKAVSLLPDRQVLLTGHNPLILDGLPLDDDSVRLFTVARSQRGRTVIRRIIITDRMREMVDNEGWSLSRMWITGHLGGVPTL